MPRVVKRFRIGQDFSEEDYEKWKEQLVWWIRETMPKVEDPVAKAEESLLACMNGTRQDGSPWPTVTNSFFSRVKQMMGFDLEKGIGLRRSITTKNSGSKITKEDLPPIDAKKALEMKEEYKKTLIKQYPHLESGVYIPKVEELSETIVRSRMLSQDFLMADNTRLDKLNKIRESLNRQVKDLMDFLEISPSILLKKTNDTSKADVSSLIVELEGYGELWQDFERIDALRELLQKYHQLHSLRPDGTPQLNDWELWHMTRNRPVHFTCRCGEEYTLLGGFTPKEIEQALIQAQKVYGFGLEGIEGKEYVDEGSINDELLPSDFMDEVPIDREDNPDELLEE